MIFRQRSFHTQTHRVSNLLQNWIKFKPSIVFENKSCISSLLWAKSKANYIQRQFPQGGKTAYVHFAVSKVSVSEGYYKMIRNQKNQEANQLNGEFRKGVSATLEYQDTLDKIPSVWKIAEIQKSTGNQCSQGSCSCFGANYCLLL